jgi:hypothetical protein
MIEATGFAEKINTTQNPQILDVRTPEDSHKDTLMMP